MFWIKREVVLECRVGEISGYNLKDGSKFKLACVGLDHPRTLMGDFFKVKESIAEVLHQLTPKRMFIPGPIVYIQLLDMLEGGVTIVEARAFREAAMMAGAKQVYVPALTSPLTEEQLMNKAFKNWDDIQKN